MNKRRNEVKGTMSQMKEGSKQAIVRKQVSKQGTKLGTKQTARKEQRKKRKKGKCEETKKRTQLKER